jgi:hypothetical protein
LVNGAVKVEYTLPHALVGEQQRLGLMSALLDPIERAPFAQLGVCPDWRCLELGCGNGSIAQVSRGTQIPDQPDARFPTGRLCGHLTKTQIDLNRSMSAKAESTN